MEKKFIMTAFGKDRPGIVADVSRLIFENNCNLEDSMMTRLAGYFTIILLFSGRDEGLEEKFSNGCRRLEVEKGLTTFVRPMPAGQVEVETPGTSHSLSVKGADQAGIVYKVSRFLAENRVNITDLRSRLERSPESGQALYFLEMRIEVPENCSLQKLSEGLAAIEDQLHLDISLM